MKCNVNFFSVFSFCSNMFLLTVPGKIVYVDCKFLGQGEIEIFWGWPVVSCEIAPSDSGASAEPRETTIVHRKINRLKRLNCCLPFENMNDIGLISYIVCFMPAGSTSRDEAETNLREVREYLKQHSQGKRSSNDNTLISFMYGIIF